MGDGLGIRQVVFKLCCCSRFRVRCNFRTSCLIYVVVGLDVDLEEGPLNDFVVCCCFVLVTLL